MVRNQFSKWNSVKVKAKYDYTCAICKSTENIQAHDPTREHKDWKVGIALCGYCHAKEHPEVPIGIFLAKNKQPYWHNISARTIAKNIGCHNRTVIRIAKKLSIATNCKISDEDIEKIWERYINKQYPVISGKYNAICPICESDKIKKAGIVPTRKGKKQRFQCKDCAKTFYIEGNK
jgi:transposase-like protein